MSKSLVQVNDDNFEQVILRSNRLALVYFWAEWSTECRMMSQIINAVAEEYACNVTVGALNVDYCPEVTYRCAISEVPTFIFFNNGNELQRIKGVTNKAWLTSNLKMYLKPKFESGYNNPPSSNNHVSNKSPYEILNVTQGASREEIITAYRRMANLYHPDKVASLAPEFRDLAETRMKEINLAYQTLIERLNS